LSADGDKEDGQTRLDLRGLKCPLPALFARRALERAKSGEKIEVLADDPMARIDMPHMCRQEGYNVVSQNEDLSGSHFVLSKP
jgi:tRNA 2-thiouridine synthesizing protein A